MRINNVPIVDGPTSEVGGVEPEGKDCEPKSPARLTSVPELGLLTELTTLERFPRHRLQHYSSSYLPF